MVNLLRSKFTYESKSEEEEPFLELQQELLWNTWLKAGSIFRNIYWQSYLLPFKLVKIVKYEKEKESHLYSWISFWFPTTCVWSWYEAILSEKGPTTLSNKFLLSHTVEAINESWISNPNRFLPNFLRFAIQRYSILESLVQMNQQLRFLSIEDWSCRNPRV